MGLDGTDAKNESIKRFTGTHSTDIKEPIQRKEQKPPYSLSLR